MGATHQTICHNWAHQIKEWQNGSKMHFNGTKLYSYSTVIGQIVTLKNKTVVYLVNDLPYSHSTSQHQSYMKSAIPVDAHVFPYGFQNFEYGWSGLGYRDEFSRKDQIAWVMRWMRDLYLEVYQFGYSKSIDLENHNKISKIYSTIKTFLDVTQCTTIKQLLRMTEKEWRRPLYTYEYKDALKLRVLLKSLYEGKSLPYLIDLVCGDGAYEAYRKRTQGARKARYVKAINYKLGFIHKGGHYYYSTHPKSYRAYSNNPSYFSMKGTVNEDSLTSKDIERFRKQGVLIQELLKIKRKNYSTNLQSYEDSEAMRRRSKSKKRLEKYIGYKSDSVSHFVYHGEVVPLDWCDKRAMSWNDYNAFRKMNKSDQISFIQKIRAELYQAYKREIYEYEVRIAQCEQEQKLLYQIQRERDEKKEYILEKKKEGVLGYLELWRNNLISSIEMKCCPNIFRGGNALLRYNKHKDIVETSKGIDVPVHECKRLWELIIRWHKNATTFISDTCHAKNHSWTISRYERDIMVAGCHAIAYCEMEDLARTLGFIE